MRSPGRAELPLVPPVVVGLAVYLMLSRSGPLGQFNYLYFVFPLANA